MQCWRAVLVREDTTGSGEAGQSPSPAEPKEAGWSRVEQGWAVKAVVMVAATWNRVQHPKWRNGVKTNGDLSPSTAEQRCSVTQTFPQDFGALSVIVLCCLRLRRGEAAARNSHHPVFDPGNHMDTPYRDSLLSCLCPGSHAELCWGGKHLLCVKHLFFLYFFFYSIAAVTVLFLFHYFLLSVGWKK